MCSTNGFTSEDDSRGGHDQVCCLVDNGERCQNQAGNASYSKRIQKTVQQRKLKLIRDDSVCILGYSPFAEYGQGDLEITEIHHRAS